MKSQWVVLVLLIAAISGCGGGDGSSGNGETGAPALTDVIDPLPGATNTVMPVFSRPFENEYQVLNYFDHDKPIWPESDGNGYQLTWRGEHAPPGKDIHGYSGHVGVDWLLAENTPVYAMTNGEVVFAGGYTAPCPLQNHEIVTGQVVRFKFVALNGDTYTANYAHLNRVDVAVGDIVSEGQQLGLSGVTGCVGKGHIAHLHLQILHYTSLNPPEAFFVDHYGWEGDGADPWASQGPGRTSVWMWKPGQAPDMVPWRQR